MIQLVRDISIAAGKEKTNEAAIYLQSIVDEQSKQGWEFYRVDTKGKLIQFFEVNLETEYKITLQH